MKLQHDCVRDILIKCEEYLFLTDELSWSPLSLRDLCSLLTQYSRGDIAYTLYLLEEAGFIEAHIVEVDSGICEIIVYRLTYTGHEFIGSIKSDNVWKKIQTALTSVGSASLPIIQSLGSHYALEYLKHL